MKIQNAFRLGLIGTLGVGVGILIISSIVSLSTIITYIGAALFIALGLDPSVSWLEKKGFPRWAAILAVLVIVILSLYFTASLHSLKTATYQLVPASKRERFADLSEQITTSVGRFVVGQAALASCNGVLSFTFLSIIGAPFPALLAVIAFLGSLIPLVGTISASVIIVLACLIPGIGSSTLTALVAAIYYIVYMQVEAYVLSPNIMRRAVSVPGAVVVVAALAGGSLLGLLGALIAIPVAAAVLMIIKQVVIPRQNEL